MKLYGAVTPFYHVSHSERLRREGEYFSREEEKIKELKDRINAKNSRISELNTSLDEFKKGKIYGIIRMIGRKLSGSK